MNHSSASPLNLGGRYNSEHGADHSLPLASLEMDEYTKRIGAYVAYFSIPSVAKDWPNARLCHFPMHCLVWIRPVKQGSDTSSVYLIHLADDIPALRTANAENNRENQKQAFADLYKGLEWDVPRVIEGMMKAENFCSDELTQIKLKTWSNNRVALVGDAAWAPTQFTGQGNQLAIIGAFVLAQELSELRSPLAFIKYEDRLRKYVEQCQEIPLYGYAPYIACPKSSLSIWLLRTGFRIALQACRVGKWLKLGSLLPSYGEDHFDLRLADT